MAAATHHNMVGGLCTASGARGGQRRSRHPTHPRLIGHSWSDSSSERLHLALIRSFPLWSWSKMCWRTASRMDRMDLMVLLEVFEITSSTLTFSPSSYSYNVGQRRRAEGLKVSRQQSAIQVAKHA